MRTLLCLGLCILASRLLSGQQDGRAPAGPEPDGMVLLGAIAPDYVHGIVRALLAHSDPVRRRLEVARLAKSGSGAAIARLVRALDDPDRPTARSARRALVFLGGRRSQAVFRAVTRGLRRARNVQGRVDVLRSLPGWATRDYLPGLLRNGGPSLRLAVIQALAIAPREEDAEAIQALLQDESRPVRKQACIALGRIRWRDAAPALIDLLEDRDRGVVSNANWALCRISRLRMGPSPRLWRTWLANQPHR